MLIQDIICCHWQVWSLGSLRPSFPWPGGTPSRGHPQPAAGSWEQVPGKIISSFSSTKLWLTPLQLQRTGSQNCVACFQLAQSLRALTGSASTPPLHPCLRWGPPGHRDAELQPGLGSRTAWEMHLPQSPPLTSSILTDFQGYSCCRLGMLLDFWQHFRHGSCFTASSKDGICV